MAVIKILVSNYVICSNLLKVNIELVSVNQNIINLRTDSNVELMVTINRMSSN